MWGDRFTVRKPSATNRGVGWMYCGSFEVRKEAESKAARVGVGSQVVDNEKRDKRGEPTVVFATGR